MEIGLKDGSLFAFAGLWERWRYKLKGQMLETYTILTTDANEPIGGRAIHDRMSVIVQPSDYGRWLEPGDPQRLPVDLPRPYDGDRMTAWRVSPAVENTRNNSAGLCEPVSLE